MENNIPIHSLYLNKTLNPLIWAEPEKQDGPIREDVLRSMIKVSEYFIDFLELDTMDLPSIPIYDVIFTGSLANYNWSEYSDIDIHIIMDLGNLDTPTRNLFKAYCEQRKKLFSIQHDVKIKGFEVEFYVEPEDEPGIESSIYSIRADKWIKIPMYIENKFDKKWIIKKTKDFMNLVSYIEENSNKPQSDEIDKILLNDLKKIWKKIKHTRKIGLEAQGEFSNENLLFKILRRNGTIQKIMDLRAKLISRFLSTKNK